MTVLTSALHILVGLFGALLLYIALFLTETEEGRIQNRLEELWVRVDDLSKFALTKEAAFLQQVSALLANGLDRLFGNKLLSMKAVATSLALSGAATLFWFHNAKELLVFSRFALIVGISLLVIAFAPGRLRYLGFTWIPLSTVWLYIGILNQAFRGLLQYLSFLGLFYMGALASDIAFVVITRWLLRKMSVQRGIWTLLALLCSLICLASVLVAPLLAVLLVLHNGGIEAVTRLGFLAFFTATFVAASNCLSAIIILLLFLLFLVAMLHRLTWPLLARPLYATQRFKVFRTPKLLASVAGSCLFFAWPQNRLIHFVLKLLHL